MTTYYTAKTGSDQNPGSFRQPFLTVAEGLHHLQNDDILNVLAGTYTEDFTFTYTSRNDHIAWLKSSKVISYPGDTVTLVSTTTSESRVLAYFDMKGIYVVPDPANYAGVTPMDIANQRDSTEPIVHALTFATNGFDYITATPSDLTRPVVTITSPSDGSEVYGSVSVVASATDNVAVDTVWLKLNGNIVYSEEPTDNCTFDWDTTLSLNGEQTLVAFAKDTTGNIGVSAPVIVTVDNVPPIEETDESLLIPKITVTIPSGGGEKWRDGTDLSLTWTSSGVYGNLNVFLVREGLAHQIFENITNTGTVSWTVFGKRGPHCQIRIESINNKKVFGISDGFEIV